jgi:hypothetical protein
MESMDADVVRLSTGAWMMRSTAATLVPPGPHRPWWKVSANAVLRFFQTRRRPARLFVVYSRFGADGSLLGYGLGWVEHLSERRIPPIDYSDINDLARKLLAEARAEAPKD